MEIGQTFGQLTVVAPVGIVNNYKAYLFRCTCGIEKVYPGSIVRTGRQRSCGCARLKNNKTSFKARRLALLKNRVKTPGKEVEGRLEVLASVFRLAARSV